VAADGTDSAATATAARMEKAPTTSATTTAEAHDPYWKWASVTCIGISCIDMRLPLLRAVSVINTDNRPGGGLT
jgi:hypothetical protein